MTIKHLVLSGGGPSLFQTIGAIQYLEQHKYIDMNEIKTIYGTSAGAIMGLLLSLKYDWNTLNDYLIMRPWQEVFSIRVDSIFEAYNKKGIFDIKHIHKVFKPLFDAKDISMDITLEEFYKISNIELHFYSYEINNNIVEDISHLTFPNLSILTAIHMTCSLPFIFTPVCLEDKCYIDGGIISNYPIKYCINSGKNIDEILGLKNDVTKDMEVNNVGIHTTLLTFATNVLFKIVRLLNIYEEKCEILHEIILDVKLIHLSYLTDTIKSAEIRKNLLNNGIDTARVFLEKIYKDNENTENDKNTT
jgi:predicted acylesterase/phospholipase RssA